MIDPTTGWSEIVKNNDKHLATISNLLEELWLCRYPLHTKIIYNRRK